MATKNTKIHKKEMAEEKTFAFSHSAFLMPFLCLFVFFVAIAFLCFASARAGVVKPCPRAG